ncbi:MAG: tetratricopeptide repeat protein [Bryobacterales bacterium]|nr:tetratricopeptide repeat protein [Bryobacterales bacterium]
MTLRHTAAFVFGILLFFSPLRADTFLVLPLFNLSEGPNLDWVGESVSETVRESLASEGVIILDRKDRDEAYHRLGIHVGAVLTRASVVKIGDMLDAGQIVYGTFRVYPPPAPGEKRSITISARVIDPKHLAQSVLFTESGALDDLADLQTHLAWQILRATRPSLALTEQEFRKQRPSIRVDALEHYIRGLLATSDEQKHRYFTQAARLDTRFSPPCFQLGRLQSANKNWAVAADWLRKVSPVDPHYNEANFLLGVACFQLADYKSAEDAFSSVVKVVPLNEVLNNLGAAQSRLQKPSAVESFRKALEGDPTDPTYHFNLGYALWKKGEFREAAANFQAVLDRAPEDAQARQYLARCRESSGPKPSEQRAAGLERLKYDFEETAYRQLKEVLSGKD